jgi:thioredoxin 1
MRVRALVLTALPLLLVACNPADPGQDGQGLSSAARSVVTIDLAPASAASSVSAAATSKAASINASSVASDGKGASQAAMAHAAPGVYVAYDASVLANGHEKVLFFHAAWCPICRTQDAELKGLYVENAADFLNTYKVDYDTEKELKARYGVTYQHTFVRVDGKGNVITKIQGPDEAQLTALLAPHADDR